MSSDNGGNIFASILGRTYLTDLSFLLEKDKTDLRKCLEKRRKRAEKLDLCEPLENVGASQLLSAEALVLAAHALVLAANVLVLAAHVLVVAAQLVVLGPETSVGEDTT